MENTSYTSRDDETPRELFRLLGQELTMDREHGTFNQPEAQEVSWLVREPKTDEEIAENLYEKLRSYGVSITIDPKEADPVSIMGAYMARKRAGNGSNTL